MANKVFRKSEEEYSRALKVIAEGTTQARIPSTLIPGAYPIFARKGKGAYIWDVDGNKYIDWILSFGTIVLGHSHPTVNAAAIHEIEEGFALPLTRPIQTELAELLSEIIPCAEKSLFLKTGSEATSAAVRLARLATGRDKIIRCGYNGWHDWCCKVTPGIPKAVLDLTLIFEYNNLDSLTKLFESNPGQIAGVILWPCEVDPPRPGFLEGVRDIAHQHDALLIFDEIRTGFHLAMGGAQEYWEVVPDLATFGKAMSNGYAISTVVGRDEYMANVRLSHFSSTYNTNSIDEAAAVATIHYMQQNHAIDHLWRIGKDLQDGLDELAQKLGVEAKAIGLPPMPFIEFTYEDPQARETAKQIFFTEAIQQGVFFHPNHHWFVSVAHGDAELAKTLDACEAAFQAVRNVL
jgi:glutamate-1-semialdehyde 2,1-aminomutase